MSKHQDKIPYIFDAQFTTEHIPPGFNAVRIRLDAQMRTSLDWKKGMEAARNFREQGLSILWDLQLGLLGNLPFPLTHDMQFKSLCLGLEHFVDTVWKDFEDATLGVCLYRGPLNFSRAFPWDLQQRSNWAAWLREGFGDVATLNQEMSLNLPNFEACDPLAVPGIACLFCQDVGGGYLDMLSQKFPDKLQAYLCLDATQDNDPLVQAQLLSGERFQHFTTFVKGGVIPLPHLTWETRVPAAGILARFPYPVTPLLSVKWGVCLPPASLRRPSQYRGLREALLRLAEKAIPYRIIPEAMLTSAWEGLDYLVVVPEGITPQGKRKLQGFEAAGGTLVEANNL